MEHLIANSGLQFASTEVEFNPLEPMLLPGGKTLRYSFSETTDFVDGTVLFQLLCYNSEEGQYVPLLELQAEDAALERLPSGRLKLDAAGVPQMVQGYPTSLLTCYTDGAPEMYTINSLQSLRCPAPQGVDDAAGGPGTKVSAFELLLGKWLPMPMFRREVDGVTSGLPLAWCRMRMERVGKGSAKGMERFRLVWAFDTRLGDDPTSILRPFIDAEVEHEASYCMANRADQLIEFMQSTEDFHAFADYVAALLGVDTEQETSRRYKAYYIYLLNFIRLLPGAAPEVTLHLGGSSAQDAVPVDLVMDIGNSRTCGILFEEGSFTRGMMLALRDMTHPETTYDGRTFDMRVVFRRADFGGDIVLDEPMFQWRSFVRVGEEARRLIYRSMEEEGMAEKTTNYSSPKRYLWDTRPYAGQWMNLVTQDDPLSLTLSEELYVPGLSGLFAPDGSFGAGQGENEVAVDFDGKRNHYSRASLMTLALIELLQQTEAQINSQAYRGKWGRVDRRRYLRRIITTCPTAMPVAEQLRLRESVADAVSALKTMDAQATPPPQNQILPEGPEIIPSPQQLRCRDEYAEPGKRVWAYDEASCNQLVYLYAEIAQRYKGEIHQFFNLKGHVRPELREQGYEGKALTIGSIDVGAGTTDVMVCAYECEGQGRSRITPVPLFWDSFYMAGDDILRTLVQNLVIEGRTEQESGPTQGSVASALTARMLSLGDDELRALPCLEANTVYQAKVQDICTTPSAEERKGKLVAFASNLVHDFFGTDSSMMGFRDRRLRTDFCTQISVPIAQRFMELLRQRRASRLYTYAELFADVQPASYLLDGFARHFGFRFEELAWRFDPEHTAALVKSSVEPLMKQLAMVLYAWHCDVVLLSGRPTSLDALTELFVKYLPVTPDRQVRLGDYHVGSWFPTADGQGYFYDQKSIVAVGAMVGYLASHGQLDGLSIDLERMIRAMKSTANYVGLYNSHRQQVGQTALSPRQSVATLDLAVLPAFVGCRQLDAAIYQARPLYALYSATGRTSLRVTLTRNFHDDPEQLHVEEVQDYQGNTLPKASVELVQQSLVDDGKYWLDKGEFELDIRLSDA